MNDDGSQPKGAETETGDADPSFSTALIFFLVFIFAVWDLNILNSRWRVDLPIGWLNKWLFLALIPYLLATATAYHRIFPKYSDHAFVWFSWAMLALHLSSIVGFPAYHVRNFGWTHYDCFRDPEIWSSRHGEMTGRISGHLCGDKLLRCDDSTAGHVSFVVIETDPLLWYEPHFAVDEAESRVRVAKVEMGQNPPAIGTRVIVERHDFPVGQTLPPRAFRVLP